MAQRSIVTTNRNPLDTPSSYESELAQYAQEAVDTSPAPLGNFISLRAGVISIGGEAVRDNKLRVIILAHRMENAYYVGEFDPDVPKSPVCYAFGTDVANMYANELSEERQHLLDYEDGVQRSPCHGCIQNAFGTADRGRGKACKNQVRLAIISTEGLTLEALPTTEVFYVKVPVTSVKGWVLYVKALAEIKKPPFAVMTELGTVPDAKTVFKLTFMPLEPISDKYMPALFARKAQVEQEIEFPYPQNTAQENLEVKGQK